jgi:Cu(I)/Ag(I) efflux system membrane fusion protein
MQAVKKLTQSNRKGLFIPIDVIREENHKYIWVEKRWSFENVMVETGVEANGMVEITSEMDSSKKSLLRGLCH